MSFEEAKLFCNRIYLNSFEWGCKNNHANNKKNKFKFCVNMRLGEMLPSSPPNNLCKIKTKQTYEGNSNFGVCECDSHARVCLCVC